MNAPLSQSLFQYWYVWAIGLLLAGIAVGFALRFVQPARRLGDELAQALAALRALKARGAAADPAAIAREAMASPRLARLWEEYRETLHAQAADEAATRWRATALAETFFTEQALVDSPLKTEFYKHLPGILTGLGIIGTFTGLIIGLIHFDVSLDPTQAQVQLSRLIDAVGHAFLVSAFAITLAMLFTWIEKSLLTARYRQVEELRELIDAMFAVGADVEYLERLVIAAETSAAQAVHIKDALAGELRGILTELNGRQLEAAARRGEQLAGELGRVIAERLGQPIADIAKAVDSVGTRQDEVVSRMIRETLAGFSTQMQDMFAGRMQETGALLQQTNAALAGTVAQFEQMAARLDGHVTGAVGRLQDQAHSAAEAQRQQSERFAHQAGEAVAGISGQVERLIVRSLEASQALQATVAALAAASHEAIAGMNAGAETLAGAAHDFAQAGQGVAATLDATAAASQNIHAAADTLLSAAGATRQLLDSHGQAQAAFAALTADLRATVDAARRDASLSAELIDRLQAAAGQLSQAERRADEYLERVNDVLIKSHQSFADNVERTLRESNRQFQKELAQAVSLLSGAIQDLGDTLDELPARRAAR